MDKPIGRFGKLTPVYYTYVNGKKYWNCMCECFHMRLVSKQKLMDGTVRSCHHCHKRGE